MSGALPRGRVATLALLVLLLLAIVAPVPFPIRLVMGGLACVIVVLFMRYVALEHARSLRNERDLRVQKEGIEAVVAQRTSQLARANEELIATMAEVRAAQTRLASSSRMAAVGMLAAGIAHEINNPLAYTQTNLELLQEAFARSGSMLPEERAAMAPELAESLAHAREGCDRMRAIVHDLGVLARPQASPATVVAVPTIVRSTVAIARSAIRHRARITEDYGPTPPVAGNGSRIGQVILNLLTNAAQAIDGCRAEPGEIQVSTSTAANGQAVIEVRDTGCGMTPEVLAKIFNPFFTTKDVGAGSGLGLSISHDIVADMGGEISVTTELGTGTTFRVALPARPGEPAEPAEAPAPAAERVTGVRRRVLVVDDEVQLLTSFRRALSREHDVVTVDTASAALERITSGELFDVIICDLMMPQMTGMDLYAALVQRAPDLAERVVFATGGACTPQTEAFLETVSNRCLYKPFTAAELRLVVTEFQPTPV